MKTKNRALGAGAMIAVLCVHFAPAALVAQVEDTQAPEAATSGETVAAPQEQPAPHQRAQAPRTGDTNDEVIPGTTPPPEAAPRERKRLTIAGMQPDAPTPTVRQPEPSVTQRLAMSPEEALRGTPFGDIVANDPDLERAILKRNGPLNREQMMRAMEIAAAIDNASPQQAAAIRQDLLETRFAQQQEFYVTTRDPDVPPTGNFVPAAAVLVEAAVDAVE